MPQPKDPIAAVTHTDPYPYYRHLLETQPLYFDHGLGMWVASSAKIITTIFNESGFYVRPSGQVVPTVLQSTEMAPVFGSFVRMTDGEYQRQMKHAIVTALSQIDLYRLRSLIDAGIADFDLRSAEHLTAALYDAMYRLPAYVVAGLLGIDQLARHQAMEMTGYVVGAVAAGAITAQIERGSAATRTLLTILEAQVERPASQQSGFVRQLLAQAREDGYAPAQVTANVIGLLMQTFDATAGLIGNGFISLVRSTAPATIRDWPSFLAEVLRHDPPVQNTRRFAAHYFEIAGQVILANETVLLVLAAANRDPKFNSNPDMFDSNRPNRQLLTFGHGAHKCPAQVLATGIASGVLSILWRKWRETTAARHAAETVTYRSLPNARIPEVAR